MTVTTNSRVLVLTAAQFIFDDTSFTFKDSSTSACTSYSYYFLSLPHLHRTAGSSDVHVPLTHVLSVGISGSAVDAHVIVRKRHGLELVNVLGSFQVDNSEANSTAKNWVREVMAAAYSGS